MSWCYPTSLPSLLATSILSFLNVFPSRVIFRFDLEPSQCWAGHYEGCPKSAKPLFPNKSHEPFKVGVRQIVVISVKVVFEETVGVTAGDAKACADQLTYCLYYWLTNLIIVNIVAPPLKVVFFLLVGGDAYECPVFTSLRIFKRGQRLPIIKRGGSTLNSEHGVASSFKC